MHQTTPPTPLGQQLSDPVALMHTLRLAADRLEAAARAASAQGLLTAYSPGDMARIRHLYVAHTGNEAMAEYIALWPTLTGVRMAWMLRQVAKEISYGELHLLPPELQRLQRQRVGWAGELAGGFLRRTE